jgi:hypothetical protein
MIGRWCGTAGIALAGLAAAPPAVAQARPGTNYDESQVPPYTLPDPLVAADGTTVADAAAWRATRRGEILRLFETHVYGKSPPRPAEIPFEVTAVDKAALNGKAVRKEVAIYVAGKKDGPRMDLLVYLPAGAKRPVPAFVGLNFRGNHTVHRDPGIALPLQWVRDKEKGVARQRAAESARGSLASRWPVERILERGYAVATAYCGDLEPDFPGGWKHGVRAALGPAGAETEFAPDDWGAIGAWAWGLRRAMDYLEKDADFDARRVAVMGHSRLGKTALWAAAQDERFALAVSNNSGCAGAALGKRIYGETVRHITGSFPHWFCATFKTYADNEAAMPVDQHQLIALIAPRPVLVCSAEEDRWADPKGEFLGAKHAGPVYKLLGTDGLAAADRPPLNALVKSTIGYHIRPGKHDVLPSDWEVYLNFADYHFRSGR